ncbi:uncharacterized protein LOC108991470 isoform X2 [Juglans regia]|uniref:Uncharacterized protein LOC108991470 isoform X2 n=1 Tax=Juglans regia TaxID=51240 RepID=A0A2I4EPP4_JUGRE|nr:uncharacterized protein LOC108991470 isoform X2 [Juglans regia]
MEDLEDSWRQMKLSKEESETIELNAEESEAVTKKGQLCLIGKICTERTIRRNIIAATMAKIWKLSRPAVFQEVGANLFVIIFNTQEDKQKIEKGKPWMFDSSLFILQKFSGDFQPGH